MIEKKFFGKYGAFKWILLVIGTIAVLALACFANLKRVVITEAGEQFDVRSVWSTNVKLPLYMEDVVDTNIVGKNEYTVNVLGLFKTTVAVEIQDTTAPVVEGKDCTIYYGDTCKPEEFVASSTDVSEVVYEFVNEPDTTVMGKQEVMIRATDIYGNSSVFSAGLEILGVRAVYILGINDPIPEGKDFVLDESYHVEYVTTPEETLSQALGDYEVKVLINGREESLIIRVVDDVEPVITTDIIKVTVNSSISYKKNINISDNCDEVEQLKMEIDNSGVDLSNVGSYTITCTVTDTAGNSTTKEIVVEVVAEGTEVYTLEQINKYADEILGRIINDSMSLEEKAYAIYRYTRSNIGYISDSQQSDWLMGAYEGMVKHLGCCFTYAATAKALLERIGLEPVVIYKEKADWTSQSNHYWLLLDLGEGYYHYDPTPRADGTWFFMWTDEQLLDYSNKHQGSHNFTRENYPAIN